MTCLQTVLCAFLLARVVSAQRPPKLRLAEVEDIAPVRQRIDLTLDPEKTTFTGEIAISVDVKKAVQTIWLNANKIAVQEASVTAAGKKIAAKAIPGGDDYLGLKLAQTVPVGAAEIRVRYSGVVRKDTSGVFQTEDAGTHYILTQFEATDARDAFPCFDEPSYKMPWRLTLRVPDAGKALSNTPIESETSANGTRTYVFRETKPLPSYLVAFAVGPFEFVDAGAAGRNHVPVRIVVPKGKSGEAKYAAEVTATILTRLEDYFGIPYPYEKSDQVSVPVTIGFGAMENAGMVTYGQNIILAKPETDTINRQRGYASVAAHELAHQWFGDLVTTSWWNDIWLNEAFATWMEQKIVAEWKPEWKTRVEDVESKLGAEEADSLMTARRIRQPIETKDDIGNAFDDITYQKGAAVIGMFESWMGAGEFRKGVRSYLERYAFRTSTAGDFLDSLSSPGQRDVAKPFSTFLEQAGVPVVSVALNCTGHTPSLHVEQSRFLPLGSKGSAAQVWNIPMCVRYGSAPGENACTLLTTPSMDWPLENARSCPAWVEANSQGQGYYRVDYRGALLGALSGGDVASRLSAPERVDLIGNASSMVDAGKLPAADELRLVETFHNDAERQVLQRALNEALGVRQNLVPDNLMPNYQRFLVKNFQPRARELGWETRAGEDDEARLLRPSLVSAMATFGGDRELAAKGQALAEKWLQDRSAVSPEMVGSVLRTAAFYGDEALYQRFLAEYLKTQDRQEKQRLQSALNSFRDRRALEIGMQAVVDKKLPLADGFPLLFAGQSYDATRKLPFEFLKAHFNQIMAGHPSVFGNDFGSFLPSAGESFCDAQSRAELQAFLGPKAGKYTGMPRNLAQTLEGIDLCIASKSAQQPSVKEFLERY